MRDTFAQFPNHFASDRQKILWIASYFWAASENLGDNCPSFNWWRGLLKKNADVLGIDPIRASSQADFVIKVLADAKSFLQCLEGVFSNHKEREEAQDKLSALRQGSKTITNVNIQFNSFLHLVDFSKSTLVTLYQAGVNSKIHDYGVIRGN